jgi:hypothetical protein
VYYALRHAGVSVDFVTEDDIAEGRLDPYRVLYMSATHMLTAASEGLVEWVQRGGMVFSSAGGGLLTEYDEPNRAMIELFGVAEHSLHEEDIIVDTKYTLPRLRPLDAIRFALPAESPGTIPAIATTQSLTAAPDATVAGTFHDGSPALIMNGVGKGKGILVGAFPGAAYVAPAIPIRPWDRGTTDGAMSHFLPTDFDPAARDLILWPARQAAVRPDITLSEAVVEWSAVDSDRGTAILLLNWTGKPIRRLVVNVRGDLGGAAVESVQHGRLEPTTTPDGWSVVLPLSITDCITIRRPA